MAIRRSRGLNPTVSARSIVLPMLLLASSPSALLAQGVFRGPYLNNVTPDAVTVIWESPTPTTGVVRYGLSGALSSSVGSTTPSTHHEVRLTGLSAIAPSGSELAYELEVQGTIYPGRFKTAVVGNAPFSFIVYGDNRSSPAQHQVVIDALLQEMPSVHFALNTGDLVSNGEDEGDWDLFFPVAAPFLASTPLFVAIGNHEVDGGSWDVTRRLFEQPTAVPPASNEEGYYHVVYGNVELIVLNVEVDSLYTISLLAGAQEEWLEEVLATRPAGVDHRFVFLHQGPYSSKVGRNGNFWLRQWLDRFRDAGVDVIFSGHDHYAERGFTENGLYYVIHGGGGAPLYETLGPRVTSDHTIIYGESRLGYARVDIDGPRAYVAIKGIGGELIDAFTYGDTAAPACASASDCGAPPVNGCPGGAWACERSACRFACGAGSGSLITCLTDSACQQSIGAQCPGTVSCEHPSLNPTSWYCDCQLPPDCTTDGDCQGRASPIPGCTGTWACVDDVCEFTATMCMPVEDAGTSPDAAEPVGDAGGGSPDAAEGHPDAASIPVPPDSGSLVPLPDAAPVALDAAVEAAADAGPADTGAGELPPIAETSDGCGCGATRPASSGAGGATGAPWLLVAGLLLLGALRVRGRAGR